MRDEPALRLRLGPPSKASREAFCRRRCARSNGTHAGQAPRPALRGMTRNRGNWGVTLTLGFRNHQWRVLLKRDPRNGGNPPSQPALVGTRNPIDGRTVFANRSYLPPSMVRRCASLASSRACTPPNVSRNKMPYIHQTAESAIKYQNKKVMMPAPASD